MCRHGGCGRSPWEAAERHFAEAELHAKRMNNRLEETELPRARMLLNRDDRGDRALAAELLREALVDYTQVRDA